MQTVQVVIEINKESYDSIMATDPRAIMGTARGLIQSGILLPKHGRLIDVDKAMKQKYKFKNNSIDYWLGVLDMGEAFLNAPTVLEGSKKCR